MYTFWLKNSAYLQHTGATAHNKHTGLVQTTVSTRLARVMSFQLGIIIFIYSSFDLVEVSSPKSKHELSKNATDM